MKYLIVPIIAIAFGIGSMSFSGSGVDNEKPATSQEKKTGLNIGDYAPELSVAGLDGEKISLSSLRGNYVLIDFWAAWCGPCRRENPHIVAAWEKYKNAGFKGCGKGDGFQIYSVSLDRDRNAWTTAIKQDKLDWPHHVSDLQFWNSEPAKIYGIASIPANFLLDPEGKIIARNLRGPAVEAELNKYLAK